MREKDLSWAGTSKIVGSLFLLGGISLSFNQFILSLRVIKLNFRSTEGDVIFTNSGDFSRFFFSSVFLFFMLLYLLVTVRGLVLRRRSMQPWPDILWKQTLAFSPLLLLVFCSFFAGKAVLFIVLIPLLPLSIILVILITLGLNFNITIKPIRMSGVSLVKSGEQWIAFFILMMFSLLFIHSITLEPNFSRFNSHRLFLGDEPKYIRMINSLAEDKDLDLSNDFEDISQDQVELEKKAILATRSRKFSHLSIIGKNGGIYHLHMPGLSFILLPGYILDKTFFSNETHNASIPAYIPERLFFLSLWILGIGILIIIMAARIIYYWLNSIYFLIIFLVLFMFYSPVPEFIVQIYPEAAACLLSLLVMNVIFFPFKPGWVNRVILVVGIGFLPWLHQRYIPLAFGLFIAFVIGTIRSQKRFKPIVIVSSLLVVASLPYFYYFFSITGSLLPNSLYTLYGESFTRLNVLPLGWFGHFFDFDQGILWLYPWTLFAFIGAYWCFKNHLKKAWMLFSIFVPYYLMICLHVTWTGLNPKPGKYLVAVFPVLLIFSLYVLIQFLNHPNYLHLGLYTGLVLSIIINKKFELIRFDFRGSFITASHIFQMIFILLLLLGLYLLLNLIDKKNWDKKTHFSLKKTRLKLLSLCKQLSKNHQVRSWSLRLLVIIPLALIFYLAFSGNFSLFQDTFFERFRKAGRYKELILKSDEDQEKKMIKGEKNFREIFFKKFDFSLIENPATDVIKLETTGFYHKIFRGAYKIELIADEGKEKCGMSVNFLSQRKNLNLVKENEKLTDSTVFFVFKEQFVPSELILRSLSPDGVDLKGSVNICPVPVFCFGEELILRPVGEWDPIRKKGPKPVYSLILLGNSKVSGKKYKISIFTLNKDNKFDHNEELLAEKEFNFNDTETHRIGLNFKLKRNIHSNLKGLALVVTGEDQKYMRCRSILYATGYDYGKIPFNFNKNKPKR